MKPPEGLLPLTVTLDGDVTLLASENRQMLFSIDEPKDGPAQEFVAHACNTHESTQAELERLKKERDLTIIELRGIADEIESARWSPLKGILGSIVDALLVKLGDLPPGYAKNGGEG